MLLGLIIGGIAGWFGRGAIASATGELKPASASRWTGELGGSSFSVERNGPTWAWRAVGGSGAEVTATAAMRQAIAFLTPNVAADAGIAMRRDDGEVVSRVDSPVGGTGEWRWSVSAVDPRAPGLGPTAVATNGASTRGRATLDMLLRLQTYT
jgi:hypothetical protein